MLREIILLAVGAIFGLGATMSGAAAPTYFPNTPPWVWHWVFWGGIAVMALMAVDAAYLLLARPRLMPGLLLNIGFLFVASATIEQFSPIVRMAQEKKGAPPTFRQVFDKDFSTGYGALALDLPFKNTPTGTDIQIPAKLFLDFHAGLPNGANGALGSWLVANIAEKLL